MPWDRGIAVSRGSSFVWSGDAADDVESFAAEGLLKRSSNSPLASVPKERAVTSRSVRESVLVRGYRGNNRTHAGAFCAAGDSCTFLGRLCVRDATSGDGEGVLPRKNIRPSSGVCRGRVEFLRRGSASRVPRLRGQVKGVVLFNISLRMLHEKKQSPLGKPLVKGLQYVLRETPLGGFFFGSVAKVSNRPIQPGTSTGEVVERGVWRGGTGSVFPSLRFNLALVRSRGSSRYYLVP